MEFKTLAMIAARVLVALVAIVLLLRLAENKFIFFPEKISINRALPPAFSGFFQKQLIDLLLGEGLVAHAFWRGNQLGVRPGIF